MKIEPMKKEQFHAWLARMDQDLDAFLHELPGNVRARLDGSLESLDVLEAWLLERYPGQSRELPQRELWVFEGAGRYIGEVYRRYTGGHWAIRVDNPKYAFYGRPELRGRRTSTTPGCPITMATASLHRRRGDFISNNVRKHLATLAGDAPPPVEIIRERNQKYGIETAEESFFKYWLTMMDSAIAELFTTMPAGLSAALDGSPGSLDILESWLLERFPDAASARAPEHVLTMDGVSRYLGQTLRRALDAEWWFDLVGWVHGGLPQLRWPVGNPAPGNTLCPLVLARIAIAERTGQVFRAHLAP